MSDLDALFRAVLDRPDDDTPRLVYADALDDHGAADRAAFIRRQVAAARAEPWEPAAVRARVFHDDAPPGEDSRAQLPELPPGLDWDARPFRRGFPAVVQARDAAAFVDADHLYDLAPVESLEIELLPITQVAALAASRALARLKRLVIRSGLGRVTARELFRSPHLTHLDELVIGAGLTSSLTAQVVVNSPTFRRLRSLSYRDEQPGGALVAALADLAAAPALRALDIQGSRLTSDDLSRFLDAPVAGRLECLDVGDNRLGGEGFRQLVAGDRLPALRRLDARQIGLGSAGVTELGGRPLASRLRYLDLGGNALVSKTGAALAELDLRELRVLDLGDNRLGDVGVSDLLRGQWVVRLLELDLSENGIGAAGADALIRSQDLDGLVALDVRGNAIPSEVRTALRQRFGDRVLL